MDKQELECKANDTVQRAVTCAWLAALRIENASDAITSYQIPPVCSLAWKQLADRQPEAGFARAELLLLLLVAVVMFFQHCK